MFDKEDLTSQQLACVLNIELAENVSNYTFEIL